MSKLIIVEGPDGAGKTKLAKLLAAEFKLDYVHGTYKDPGTYEWFMEQFKRGGIIDRTFISEQIYSRVLERKCRVSEDECNKLVKYLYDAQALIFYCTAPTILLKIRAFSRGEDYITEDQLTKIAELYNAYFKLSRLNVLMTTVSLSDITLGSLTD